MLFVVSLISSGLVHAVDTKEANEQSNVVIIEPNSQEEAVEQFQIWGTYAEAQFAYGPSWTYAVLGYNSSGGYFLCTRQKADGSFFYFGCYSL